MAITDRWLHQLVVGSHAEGTTRLAVAAAIEHDDRVLLIATEDNDFQPIWQLPSDLVLPGETLLDGLARTVTITTGLGVIEVTSYVGHVDRDLDGEIVRTFVFTVTAQDPERVCHWAKIRHRWSPEPVTASLAIGDSDSYRTPTAYDRPIGQTSMDILAAALQANAKGLLCTEAAVDLLIQQQSWLYRRDFVDSHVETDTTTNTATVNWAEAITALNAGRLPCSSGESQLLRIASSLAQGTPVDLRAATTTLDAANTALVADAICHAAGHQQSNPKTG
jgi:ADP-ribose pyrophosphatase YjhB (NUDIX family)